MLSLKRLNSLLSYDPKTGQMRWLSKTSPAHMVGIGSLAGSKDAKGYLRIMIDGRRYGVHQLAWVISTGKWAKRHVDHINGVKGDNRLLNLREATDSQNKANGGAYKGSLSGIKGAYYEPQRTSYKKWRAVIRKGGKLKHLGYFATPEEANAAFAAAATKLHGEFARAA